MEKHEFDAWKTIELISDPIKVEQSRLFASDNDGYSKIYPRSNEDLNYIFRNFDVRDKNVLTVLSSSDQVFASYYLGAKNVDAFDINCLTEYYYYLRKWLIEYREEYYPDFGKIIFDSSWISSLLKLVSCSSAKEERAYKYWSLYVLGVADLDGASVFNYSHCKYNKVIDDLSVMKELLRDRELNFTREDIGGKIKKDKKYQVIIISNILEYITFDMERLGRVRDNLFDILEDDGQIIASHFMDCNTAPTELEVFSKKFKFNDFQDSSIAKNSYSAGGYCYTKK